MNHHEKKSSVPPEVILYTDGACRGNPGPGGWGVVMNYGKAQRTMYGGESLTTNNRMELMAVIQGLSVLKRPCRVKVFSDSKYVLQGITEWLPKWKRSGWRTTSKKSVANVDLWQQLDSFVQQHEMQWKWVKGHSGNEGNEFADALANKGIDELY
jgi:ribonuclease HI